MDWLTTLIIGIVVIAIGYIVRHVFTQDILKRLGYAIIIIGAAVVVIALILLIVSLI